MSCRTAKIMGQAGPVLSLAITMFWSGVSIASEESAKTKEDLLLDYKVEAKGLLGAGITHLVGGSVLGVASAIWGVDQLIDLEQCQQHLYHEAGDEVCDESGLSGVGGGIFAYGLGLTAIAHLSLGSILVTLGVVKTLKRKQLENTDVDGEIALDDLSWAPTMDEIPALQDLARGYRIAGGLQLGWAGGYVLGGILLSVVERKMICPDDTCVDSIRSNVTLPLLIGLFMMAIPHIIAGSVLIDRSRKCSEWLGLLKGERMGWMPSVSVGMMPGRGGGIGFSWTF